MKLIGYPGLLIMQAFRKQSFRPPAVINVLLPLFLESAHSVAMIKHSMTIVQAAVQHLNPGQHMNNGI